MIVDIAVEGTPTSEGIELLRSHMLQSPVPVELRIPDDAYIRLRSSIVEFGAIHRLSTVGGGGDVWRTPRLARDSTPPSLILSVVERGSAVVTQFGRKAYLDEGDIVAYATTSPYTSSHEADGVRHSFVVPLDLLAMPTALVYSQLACVFGTDHPVAPIVQSYLLTLVASPMTAQERRTFEQPTIDLVRALLASESVGSTRRIPPAETLGMRVLEYLRTNLGDPQLSAQSVAAAHGISERHLGRVLDRMNVSLVDWVREKRLVAAARSLARPSSEFVTISAIAQRCGFGDRSSFSRLFAETFGLTPREWRRLHETSDGGDFLPYALPPLS